MKFNDSSVLHWLTKLLIERFNKDLKLHVSNGAYILSLKGIESRIIFDNPNEKFYEIGSVLNHSEWEAESECWVSLQGKRLPMPGGIHSTATLIEEKDEDYLIHYNILGLAYWMLVRVEEIDNVNLDEHNRFPGKNSHAYKHGYLDRPVVDEWFDILAQVMCKVWPNILIKKHEPSIIVTCDVDNPFSDDISIRTFPRRIAKNLIRQKSIPAALSTCRSYIRCVTHSSNVDPYIKNIYWLMEVNETVGNQVIFYFLAGGNHKFDSNYSLTDPRIKKLMVDITARGHKIGLHPSYNSYKDPIMLSEEASRFREVLDHLGLECANLESRQHFLRWHPVDTPNYLEQIGVSFDSTICYADIPGFRSGTAIDYCMFDGKHGRLLNLRQRPLIVMESSLIEHRYMALGYSDATLQQILKYKANAFLGGGQFVFLWHNSSFDSHESYSIYKDVIRLR
jgi:hypothetical protein